MSNRCFGYYPPLSRGSGFLTVFYSLADVLARRRSLHCWIPENLMGDHPKIKNVEFHRFSKDVIRTSSFWSEGESYPASLFLLDECGREDWGSSFPFTKFDAVCVGLNPVVPDFQAARVILARWLSEGLKSERLHLLLFRKDLPQGLPLTLLQKELKRPIHVLPDDLEAVIKAENHGLALAEFSPKSKLIKAVSQLAAVFEETRRGEDDENDRLDKDRKINLEEFSQTILDRFWTSLTQDEFYLTLQDETVKERLEKIIESFLMEHPSKSVLKADINAVRSKLLHQILGWGPLEPLMEDPNLSEIMVNGPSNIYIERSGRMETCPVRFANELQLKIVIDRMVGEAGRRVDTASPLCDIRLRDGSRVNVVLPPVSLQGPVLTLRRFRSDFREIKDLIAAGSLDPVLAESLVEAIKKRMNIVIAGNSGSGKTTLMNILSKYIDPTERVITLEDAAELQLQQPHVIRLETRKKNLEGIGEINMSDLVINALRMRPDRLIIGECRGAEVIPMLQAMNTGHDGSMTTLHANSAEEGVRRLESMILLGAPQWTAEVARRLMAAGVDLIVYLKRVGTERHVESIAQMNFENGRIFLTPYSSDSGGRENS